MDKKGQTELADLAGFILIFLITIIFGFVFIQTSPAKIQLISGEHENYLARHELINYLSKEENGKNMADMIILAVRDNNFENVEDKTKELFKKAKGSYRFVISKDGEPIEEIAIGRFWGIPDESIRNFAMDLENFDGGSVRVKLILSTYYTVI